MTRIRPAVAADIPDLVRLLGQLFDQEAEFHPDPPAQARGLAAIIGQPQTGRILLAEEGGPALGMINILYTVSTALGTRVGLFEDVVVDAGCRDRGIGRALMGHAIETARADGCRRITLLTDTGNRRAHRFYEAFGFTRSSMTVMRLALNPTLAA